MSVAVPATDAGSGVYQVTLSNSPAMSPSTTFAYHSPISWTVAAGDGPKTVYATWTDNKGNTSGVLSDGIVLDTTAPTGSVSINSGAATTTSRSVTLGLSASDGAGSGLASVKVANSADMAGAQTVPFAASI